MFGVIGRWVVPWLQKQTDFKIELIADVVLIALTLMAPHIYGALIGFSILDDRDDHILTSIKVTPLSVFQFLAFRLGMRLCFSIFNSSIPHPIFKFTSHFRFHASIGCCFQL
ncbi:hypothetical protein KHA80_15335 [Anaerobacillus sp. HL2]|nr:hypothetical protein KHA80_15335 [Anaerobacillus sp. HL2]